MAGNLGQFKDQPWIVFDTVAAKSFLVGETRADFRAFGTNGPAINQAGELLFFAAGRTEPNAPWYTSTELVGQLSYGFEAYQVYVHFGFPPYPAINESDGDDEGEGHLSPTVALMQAIINFGVLQMDLGQEQQMSWPVHRFGAGGGMHLMGSFGSTTSQNSLPESANVLALPEPVAIARTQNLNCKIRLAPEALPLIGTNSDPGVGTELSEFEIQLEDTSPSIPQFPFSIQVGLIGKRIKKTQYGQVPE